MTKSINERTNGRINKNKQHTMHGTKQQVNRQTHRQIQNSKPTNQTELKRTKSNQGKQNQITRASRRLQFSAPCPCTTNRCQLSITQPFVPSIRHIHAGAYAVNVANNTRPFTYANISSANDGVGHAALYIHHYCVD